MRDPSRREFLGGAAGVVAVAALPRSHSTTRSAATPLLGGIVNPKAYGVSSYLPAAEIFNKYVGLPLATTFQKVYMTHGQFGSQLPIKMAQLAPSGCRFLISVEPSLTMTRNEQATMAKFLAMLNKSGLSYRVALYAEPDNKAFNTVQAWLPYWRYYAPIIKDAGVTLCYEPGCGSTRVSRAEAYFPSNPTPDEMWMDSYATAYRGGARLDDMIAIAQAAGVPAGMGEWGWAGGAGPIHDPLTMSWWNEYCTYLIGLGTAGKLKLGAMYFGAASLGRTVDVITGPKDPRIPMIHKVVSAIQSGS